jgi:hypothetical protein
VSKRWLEQFSIPGFSAYEANQRTLKTFGSGAQAPDIVVIHVKGDVTKSAAAKQSRGVPTTSAACSTSTTRSPYTPRVTGLLPRRVEVACRPLTDRTRPAFAPAAPSVFAIPHSLAKFGAIWYSRARVKHKRTRRAEEN